jgi:hypothetical protein
VAGHTQCVPLSPNVTRRTGPRRETLEPPLEPLDVRPAAGEELAPEAHVETGSADEVGHEGIAGDEATMGQSDRKGADIEPVACALPSLWEVAFENRFEAPLALTLHRAEVLQQCQAGGELTQELEQRQVGARR